jgi:hypothetical protein
VAAVQLDSNANADPYHLFVDNVTMSWATA